MGSNAFCFPLGWNPGLSIVRRTHRIGRWVPSMGGQEIARGLAKKNEFGAVPSDARIEAGNDVAQTMIDAAYGHRDFERSGKRFLLMRWNARR